MIKVTRNGAGELAQWLRTHTALSKDQSSISSTHIKFPASGETDALFWPPLVTVVMCKHTHTSKNKMNIMNILLPLHM